MKNEIDTISFIMFRKYLSWWDINDDKWVDLYDMILALSNYFKELE